MERTGWIGTLQITLHKPANINVLFELYKNTQYNIMLTLKTLNLGAFNHTKAETLCDIFPLTIETPYCPE